MTEQKFKIEIYEKKNNKILEIKEDINKLIDKLIGNKLK